MGFFFRKFFTAGFLLGILLHSILPAYANEKIGKLMAEAQSAYQEGRFNRAGLILLRITRENPNHRGAYLLLGQVYYAKEELDKAKVSFELARPKQIETRFAFAWGAAFYDAGEWRQAIRGFKQSVDVPGLEDFSHYYLGASYFQLRAYFRAQQHLNQARSARLPGRLRRNKQRLLQQIRLQKERDLRAVIGSSSTRQRPSQNISQGVIRGVPIPANQMAGAYRFRSPEEEQSKGSRSQTLVQTTWTPAMNFQQSSLLNENFRLVRNRVELTAHRESVAASVTKLIEDNRYQENQTIGLQIFGGNAHYDARISDERIITLEDTTGGFIEKTTSSLRENLAFYGVEPFFQLPVSRYSHLRFSVLHYETLPSYDRKQGWGVSLGKVSYRVEQSSSSIFALASYSNQFDRQENFSFQDARYTLGLNYDFGELQVELAADFLLTAGNHFPTENPFRFVIADHRVRIPDGYRGYRAFRGQAMMHFPIGGFGLSFERKDRYLYGGSRPSRQRQTDQIELAALGIGQVALRYVTSFFTGVSLALEAYYQLYDGYLFESAVDEITATQQRFQTGVTQTGYQAAVNISPLEWLQFQARFATHTNQFDGESSLGEVFRSQNPNFGAVTSLFIELKKDF